jgi:hypothetical protein
LKKVRAVLKIILQLKETGFIKQEVGPVVFGAESPSSNVKELVDLFIKLTYSLIHFQLYVMMY